MSCCRCTRCQDDGTVCIYYTRNVHCLSGKEAPFQYEPPSVGILSSIRTFSPFVPASFLFLMSKRGKKNVLQDKQSCQLSTKSPKLEEIVSLQHTWEETSPGSDGSTRTRQCECGKYLNTEYITSKVCQSTL